MARAKSTTDDDGLTAVHTTMRPDVELRVDERELAHLRALGVLDEDAAPSTTENQE